jgi:thioredoxin reductase (NADPH)
MSSYLLTRLVADSRVTIMVNTEVTGLAGTASLERTLANNTSASSIEQACRGLFCFIGAQPATEWLDHIDLNHDGSILTDTQLDQGSLGAPWSTLGRNPLPFETSIPNVFAAGDVRLGSIKRVAAAVGEGASAIRSVHTAIGPRA